MSEVGLPEKLAPPPTWQKAAGMTVDRLNCLRVRQQGEQSEVRFAVDGLAVSSLQGPALGIAEQQYSATCAVFEWLGDADRQSPWRSDLG